ncbi:GNAT family N-acetyltransferase, partial [Stenotrophomonas maltophilia]|nr:GNAT family N-acetyltransferase [Stenotrophomonas maltophilia]
MDLCLNRIRPAAAAITLLQRFEWSAAAGLAIVAGMISPYPTPA